MFKLALVAGHYLETPGKRCLKSIDPNETKEWVLNSRICDKIESLLAQYDGIEILRIDDRTGQKNIPLIDRTNAANKFDADFYLSIHHNAGINGGSGGGIVAYVYLQVDDVTKAWQKELYDAAVAQTGLKGNRSVPLASADLHECRETKMPAVLMEMGFMDSTTDTPIILTDDYAAKSADALVSVIVKRAGLTKKPDNNSDNDSGNSNTDSSDKLYYVQAGAFKSKENAEKLKQDLNNNGFDAIIK